MWENWQLKNGSFGSRHPLLYRWVFKSPLKKLRSRQNSATSWMGSHSSAHFLSELKRIHTAHLRILAGECRRQFGSVADELLACVVLERGWCDSCLETTTIKWISLRKVGWTHLQELDERLLFVIAHLLDVINEFSPFFTADFVAL